ncbi:hypothetical protein KIH41_17610 [Litoribacter ruber]|uniref:hypothetical protein n=1 Tax=Litoribacter ruber TaxID=702568 RepID=UPI001BDB28FE|nr:hypothetical protein [Litoribacter ruber]MBT0813110.1 hypothetical protein [Litoribacter ruber]
MDFNQLEKFCVDHSRKGEEILEWIMYYGAGKDRLDKQFDQQAKPFKHVLRELAPATFRELKAQFITFKILKENGLIHKYLNHSSVKNRAPHDYSYLQKAAQKPYRFAFLLAKDNPAPNFFNMQDVFTGEELLMYSPGVAQDYGDALMFYCMVSDNGQCYQTYGPIGAFRGFDPNDIFFYASELNPAITTDEELQEFVQKVPLKFSALLPFTNIPVTVHGKDELIEIVTFGNTQGIKKSGLNKDFEVKTFEDFQICTLKRYGEFPHFATLFLDWKEDEMVLSAMTDAGYDKMVEAVAKLGANIPEYADIRLHPSMKIAMKDILKKEILLHPFDASVSDDESLDDMDKESLNLLLDKLIFLVNENRRPDFAKLAHEFSQDENTVKDLYKLILEKVGKR